MSNMQRVQLLLGTEHVCGYLPQISARNAYVNPGFPLNADRYAWLLAHGFRRSGDHVYRPHCAHCRRCTPARIPVAAFHPDRNQRRCITRNADLALCISDSLSDEHYALYLAYLRARHAGNGMDVDNRDAFHTFLECSWGDAQFWEFRDAGGHLLAVAVVDLLADALSAVYTFFDPAATARSLGTYAVLAQIAHAREQGLAYLYLGYWVAGSRKMDYKKNFRPLEVLRGLDWQSLETPPPSG
ncbi:MAG: arginyltransferase [Stenotrophobium sp.]